MGCPQPLMPLLLPVLPVWRTADLQPWLLRMLALAALSASLVRLVPLEAPLLLGQVPRGLCLMP